MTIKKGYIRVSSILSQWDKFGHIDQDVLNAKAKLGTEVHAAIDNQDEIFCPISEKAEGYLQSFKEWHDKCPCVLVEKEMRLYCDTLKITGQIDALYQFPGSDSLILVDYKTSAQASPKDWEMQGTFYYYLAKTNGFKIADRFLFIQLKKDGKPPKVYEFKYDPKMMGIAISALNCYKWRNNL